jgi:hypothetical protein
MEKQCPQRNVVTYLSNGDITGFNCIPMGPREKDSKPLYKLLKDQ